MGEPIVKRYMELQMEELKEALSSQSEGSAPKEEVKGNSKHAELAKMYEDCYEYEKDLEIFEAELEIVNANELKDISQALSEKFPNEERDYPQELKTVVVIGWTNLVEVQQTHPQAQLDVINDSTFNEMVDKLNAAFPDYSGNFEKEIRTLLVKRWENLIAIKQEHIQEELDEIETAGLKHHYVKRVYKEYHGITD